MNNAVIILNYNDYENTLELVNILNNYSSINYIIIVDNCSTNNSYEKMKSVETEKIKVIKTEYNGGYAYGNNFGIRYAISNYNINYAIIANPDARFDEDFILKVNNEIINLNEKIGIIAPQIDDKIDNCWKLPRFRNLLACPFLALSKKFGNLRYKNDISDSSEDIKDVEVLSGSLFLIMIDAYNKIEGLDEETFLYFEENILAYKLKKLKYKNYLIKNIKFTHKSSTSIDMTYKSKIKPYNIYIKSMYIYAKKYLKINKIKLFILNIFVCLGYIERYMYDFLFKIKFFLKKLTK